MVVGQTVIGAGGGKALQVQGQGAKSAAVFLKLDTKVGGSMLLSLRSGGRSVGLSGQVARTELLYCLAPCVVADAS